MDQLLNQKSIVVASGSTANENIVDINDQIENLNAKLDYVQDQISDCQKQIIDVEDSKEESDDTNLDNFLECQTIDEAQYILRHLVSFCIASVSLKFYLFLLKKCLN